MTETERTIERGTVRVRRGPEGCLAASVQDVPLWVGYLHPQTARALIAAAAAALGDEVVCVSRERLDDALQQAQLWQLNNGERGKTPHDDAAGEARGKIIARLTAAPAGREES